VILAVAALAALPQGVGHVRSVLPVDGTLLNWHTADADGDGLLDLFLALRFDDGRRELRVHRLRRDGAMPATPDHRVEMKKDIVAWGTGDFLPEEPGVELLLTTRSSAFALPTTAEGYRGIRRLGGGDFLLDLPTPRLLPRWPAIGDLDGDGRDEVVLPTTSGFQVLGLVGEWGVLELKPSTGRRPALERAFQVGRASVSAQPLDELIVPSSDPAALAPPPVAWASESLPLPWLADADGDGLLDVVYEWEGTIQVHTQHAAGESPRFSPAPDRSTPYENGGDWEVIGLELVDAGGGPQVDLLVTRRDKDFSLSDDWEVLLFHDALGPGGSLARPAALAATEASFVSPSLGDLQPADGRMDLILSTWTLDVGVIGGTRVEIEHEVLAYPADADGRIARRPALSYRRDYAADDFTAFSAVPAAPGDLAGDGGLDLLEADPDGVLEFRAVTALGGRLSVSRDPVRRIEVDALGAWVEATDLDGDGVVDLLIRKEDQVEVYVARKR
jgi:hypothetical protein